MTILYYKIILGADVFLNIMHL